MIPRYPLLQQQRSGCAWGRPFRDNWLMTATFPAQMDYLGHPTDALRGKLPFLTVFSR